MSFQSTASFPRDAASPGRARSWASGQISAALDRRTRLPTVLDDAVLIVSELITNAIRAGCSCAELSIEVGNDAIRLGVVDDGPGVPAVRLAGPEDVHGRGLFLLAALAADWGVRKTSNGKEVWASLPLSSG